MVKKLYVDHDYDLAFSSANLSDAAPYIRLFSRLDSKSSNNALGYTNPDMDAALAKVKSAPTDEAKTAALAEVQKLFNYTVPLVTLGALSSFIPWQKNVHGIKVTADAIILFDKAWIKQRAKDMSVRFSHCIDQPYSSTVRRRVRLRVRSAA